MNLHEQVRDWIAQDPDPVTRAELEDLLAAGADDDLAERFSGTLEFGTAGLRAEVAAGPMRMNRVVVSRAAAGLAEYLLAENDSPSVVIGYDGRINSDVFARDTAEVMAGAGIRALLLPGPLPTPVLAFAIGHLGTSAGVMVTASHNPPRDNGYKVYLGDTSQIVSPVDQQIAARITAVGRVDELPRSDDWTELGDEVRAAYAEAVVAGVPQPKASVSAVYTPMHGVGGEVFKAVAQSAGFDQLEVVAEQFEPDATFKTVAFPNPEEPGAMDLALELARRSNADLVIANDPDADRLALGVRDGDSHRMLSGDQVGWLLAEALIRRGAKGTFANSIVSSALLDRIAANAGQDSTRTLTGFKWIGKVPDLAYGYEEALGYCVRPDLIRDKDGISAALLAWSFADELAAEGRTLLDVLDDLAREHGVYATGQLSVRVEQTELIAAAMTRLRTEPPTSIAGDPVTKIIDLAAGTPELPPTDGLWFTLASGATIICRPSGTEPKLKCYLEVVVPDGEDLEAARSLAAERLEELRESLAVILEFDA